MYCRAVKVIGSLNDIFFAGGAYVGPTQDRILHIIDELGLELQPVNTAGQTVQIIDGSVRCFAGTIPPVSFLGMLDLNSAMVRMDALTKTMNLSHPHLSENAVRLDSITVEELIIQSTWTEDARSILRTAVRAILCTEPCALSALFFLWYIAQSGGVKRIFETEGGAQNSKVKGGAGRIAELLAKKYAPIHSKLFVGTPIRRIDTSGLAVRLETHAGLIIEANHVILAIPPVQQLRIEFVPALSAERFLSLQRWPMGCICKTFMYYETRFWAKDFNGSIIADDGVVCVTYDDTKLDGSKPCIMGFVLSNESLHERSREDRIKAICERYAEAFQTDEALNYVDYKEKKWAEEQWVGGCYVGTAGPNVLTSCKRVHCEPLAGKVFVAGTEAAHRMIGYMDGAVEAGERAARNVLVTLGLINESQYEKISSPPASKQLDTQPMEITSIEKVLPSVISVLSICTVVVGIAVVRYLKR